jgi:hypothetical protein
MEKENADESSCLMSSMSRRSYTQSAGILERGGGRLLKLLEIEGEDDVGVGKEEEIVGTGGGGYLGRLLLLLLFLRGKAGSS